MNDNATKLGECEPSPEAAAFTDGTLVRSTNDLYKCYGIDRIQNVHGELAKVPCDTMMSKRR